MATRSFLDALTGSFSTPAGDNPTVAMVEAAYRDLGLQARYLNCEVRPEALGDAVRGARAMGWLGFNCSLPHKVAVVEHLDDLAESARIIGAVNCVVRQGDRLIGENTDGQGFLASLREVTDPSGRGVAVLGAGGAARAIAVELALAGARAITIVNRDEGRGNELAALVRDRTGVAAEAARWDRPFAVPAGIDILVNATSIGLAPNGGTLPAVALDNLRPGLVVADVIPNPPRTALLREAERRGCMAVDGLGMLVAQGAIAIELWTGAVPSRQVMRDALTAIFAP